MNEEQLEKVRNYNGHCHTCGKDFVGLSFGGPNVCSRCDCGIKPNGEKWSYEELKIILARFQQGITPHMTEEMLKINPH